MNDSSTEDVEVRATKLATAGELSKSDLPNVF